MKRKYVGLLLGLLVFLSGCTTHAEAERSLLQTTLRANDTDYQVSLEIPSDLEEYLSLEALEEQEGFALIHFASGNSVANIGTLALYPAEEYDALKKEELPLEDEVLRDEQNQVVLAFQGIQDSVFEPGSEEAELVLQYHDALEEILSSLTLQKVSDETNASAA